jgi:hypothetical protein
MSQIMDDWAKRSKAVIEKIKEAEAREFEDMLKAWTR